MKKKATLVILIPLVILVWGLIGVRIWKMTRPEADPVPVGKAEKKVAAPAVRDTLLLNYRDPFLDRQAEKKKEVVRPAQTDYYYEEPAPQLRFKGTVRGKDGVVRAIVLVDDDWKALAKGDQVLGATIAGMEPDCLILSWKGKRVFINAE